LLVRRDWKAVAWTVVACIGLCAATLVLFGTSPYEAFINDQLPAIASGKAFWFAFEKPGAMLSNTSVMGLFYKIKESGIATDWDPRLTAKIASWVYSLALVGIAVVAGRRDAKVSADEMGRNPLTRLRIARSWVALIVLAQARSPFLPEVYGSTAILFLLALMLPVDRASFARLFIVAAAMCLFATGLPYPMGPVRSAFDFGLSMLATVFVLCLAFVMATRRCPRAAPASLFSTAAHESV
jgi:hypothetical protein